MNTIQLILIIVFSSGGFTGLIYFILKRWFQKQLDKNLETHKGEVNKGLETHKGEIKKEFDTQLESHKGAIQEDLENLKDSYIKENLESTRFVEVICRQRIVWSDQLRDDITVIVAKTQLFVEISEKHLQEFGFDAIAKGLDMIQNDKFSANDAGSVINTSINNSKTSLPIKIEVITAITRLKLKLNPIQDASVILLLKSIRNLIENPTNNKQEIYNKLIGLQTEGQELLKREWNRVKQEVQKGKEIEKLKSQELPPLGKVNMPLIKPFQKQ